MKLNNGAIAFIKLTRPGDWGFYLSELETYQRIRDASINPNIRISRLHGLVRDDEGIVYGLLLTYIDCARRTLYCAARKPGQDNLLLQKWSRQLKGVLGQFHDTGIAWGDAKPDNILVDHANDLWLVDFGGSYAEGWVPKELAGTVEGDLVGLKRITEYIYSNGCQPGRNVT